MESSVHRPPPPNTCSYVHKENLGLTRKFVKKYLLFCVFRYQQNSCSTPGEPGLEEPFQDSGKKFLQPMRSECIGQNRYHNFGYGLWVKRYLLFSCAVSCHTEFAHMYVRGQYRGHVRLLKRRELGEPDHPRDVIGSQHGISINSLLVQCI